MLSFKTQGMIFVWRYSKINLLISASNIDCGINKELPSEAVLTSTDTDNQCYGADCIGKIMPIPANSTFPYKI